MCADINYDGETKNKKIKLMPKPKDLKHCIMSTTEPLLLHGLLDSWDIIKWTLDDWSRQMGQRNLDFRVGSKSCKKTPQWEDTCKTVSCPFEVFIRKTQDMKDDFMYFDYKYMHEYFQSDSLISKAVSWIDLGFDGKTGEDSTIWIGSEGAHTPCHMDTYGCNVVAQIHGRKSWIMFAPEYTSSLKPMRVPYEESSIYSQYSFQCGASDIPDVKEARVIELCPGDVLVVPKHWWHYVENLSTAISINMWVPLPSDDNSRLEESLVRYFITSAVKNIALDEQHFLLNPNEIDLTSEVNDIRQINWCINNCKKEEQLEEVSAEDHTAVLDTVLSEFSEVVSKVPSVSVSELKMCLRKCKCESKMKEEQGSDQYVLIQHVINAFCHPEVVSKVKDILMKQVRPNN